MKWQLFRFRLSYYFILIVLTALVCLLWSGRISFRLPLALSSPIDSGYFSDEEGKDLQVTLSYKQLESHFTAAQREYLINPNPLSYWSLTEHEKKDLKVREVPIFEVAIKNVSEKVIALRPRLRVYEAEDHSPGERGEESFQLFVLNTWNGKEALHHYYDGGMRPNTELDGPLDSGLVVTCDYRLVHGDDDFSKIGSHGVLAGVRYLDYDPTKPMSEEAKSKLKNYVAWSNVVHLPAYNNL